MTETYLALLEESLRKKLQEPPLPGRLGTLPQAWR